MGAAHSRHQWDMGRLHGVGSKTIIPSKASAKVSFHLVPDQDAQTVYAAFQRFVAGRLPPGAEVTFAAFGVSPGMEIATGYAMGEGGARCPSARIRATPCYDR
jgi:acetylornithine deacetylase/succinyl-diaminopimelate desuccinylase-like protein